VRILIVEDEAELGALLSRRLRQHAMVSDVVGCIEDAELVARSEQYDAIILDRMLPDGDGLTAIPALRRAQPQASIVVLSAQASIPDRVQGLDAGADDYLPKPSAIDELVARLRAVARRGAVLESQVIRVAGLTFDPVSGDILVGDELLALPRRELLMLQALLRHAGRTVTRSALEQAAYGMDDEIGPNALDPHISRLRRRLEQAGAGVEIHALRGIGYLLREQPG
jgi:two-component system OmpR family response regulator